MERARVPLSRGRARHDPTIQLHRAVAKLGYRACFGSRRSAVRIRPARPPSAGPVRTANPLAGSWRWCPWPAKGEARRRTSFPGWGGFELQGVSLHPVMMRPYSITIDAYPQHVGSLGKPCGRLYKQTLTARDRGRSHGGDPPGWVASLGGGWRGRGGGRGGGRREQGSSREHSPTDQERLLRMSARS